MFKYMWTKQKNPVLILYIVMAHLNPVLDSNIQYVVFLLFKNTTYIQ